MYLIFWIIPHIYSSVKVKVQTQVSGAKAIRTFLTLRTSVPISVMHGTCLGEIGDRGTCRGDLGDLGHSEASCIICRFGDRGGSSSSSEDLGGGGGHVFMGSAESTTSLGNTLSLLGEGIRSLIYLLHPKEGRK